MAKTKKTSDKGAKAGSGDQAAKPETGAAKSDAAAGSDAHAEGGSGDGGGHGGHGGGHDDGDFHDNIQLGAEADGLMKVAGGIGAVALVASIGLGVSANDGLDQFSWSYLVAFAFVLAIGLGSLWWVTLQHLVNARWSIVVRRVGELFAANMPLLALLSLPIVVPVLLGNHSLYEWANAEAVKANHALAHKAAYLNVKFFAIRVVGYFAFWALLARHWLSTSLLQDQGKNPELPQKNQGLAAPTMIAVALTLTFASIDFVMSTDGEFFSTIFGVYYFAGCVISVNSALALTLFWLQGKGRMTKTVTVHHFHDLGKMMFAFTVFWAYIAFSQFMLMWYANLPEETYWYKIRFAGEWGNVSWALLFLHFVVPFLGLISRWVKRHRMGLGFWAVWLLVMEYVDLYWLVMPSRHSVHGHLHPHLLDVTCLVALVSLFIAGVAFNARKVNLVPIKDPRLKRSLAFFNI